MAFDYGAYLTAVAKLQSGLAELHGIDAALKYMDELQSTGLSPTGVHKGYPTWVKCHLGTTHPFDVSVAVYPTLQDAAAAQTQTVNQVNEVVASGAAYVAGAFTAFNDSVTEIVVPDSATLDQLARGLSNQVNHPLTTLVSTDFGELEHSLSDWRGEAADDFADKFYNQFYQMVQNQAWLAGCLGLLVSGVKGIVDLAQHSLQNMLSKMWDAVDEQLQQRHDANQSTGFSLGHFLALAALATGLLALIEFPEADAAAGTVLEATTHSLVYAESSVPEGDAEKHEIKAAYTNEFLEQLGTSTTRIVQNYHANLDALNTEKVVALKSDFHDIMEKNLLYPPPLAFTEGPVRPGDFYNVS